MASYLKQFAILIHNFELQLIGRLMIQVILLVVNGLFWHALHPFHLSICEMEFDEDAKTLQITSRIFQDDFEVALAQTSGSGGYFSNTDTKEIEKELQVYFDKHLRVSIDEIPLQHSLIGFEIENNVVWCYLEIEQVESNRPYFCPVQCFD